LAVAKINTNGQMIF